MRLGVKDTARAIEAAQALAEDVGSRYFTLAQGVDQRV
jgi:hypothetical protein